jgi:hypothetical protein
MRIATNEPTSHPPPAAFLESCRRRGLRSRAHTLDKGLDPAALTRRLFLLLFVRPGDLPALRLRFPVSRCDRFRRPRKFGSPPPFAPPLKIQGDDTHNNSGFLVI